LTYLLDTNVVSELRKGQRANPTVRSWFAAVDASDLYLSALVVGELRRGVENLRRRDPAAGTALDGWLRLLVTEYSERILDVTAEVADAWGRFNVPAVLPVIDSLIAATAHVNGLTVVTRNTADFGRTGVAVLDPFKP
jgi:hypothetical protein